MGIDPGFAKLGSFGNDFSGRFVGLLVLLGLSPASLGFGLAVLRIAVVSSRSWPSSGSVPELRPSPNSAPRTPPPAELVPVPELVPAANGTFDITPHGTDPAKFTLDGSAGNGTFVSGAGRVTGGSMAFYDEDTKADANTALGRALVQFNSQDDDPTVNSSADANFLRDRLKDHVEVIRSAVAAATPATTFEVLFADDVNRDPLYWRQVVPTPQGGRLNRHVNLPTQWQTKAGSNLDRMKVEALSWGATYRNHGLAREAMQFAFNDLTWAKADSRYLIPWFNGGGAVGS